MNWDKKSISATLVCFLFVMGYMYYLQHKYPDYYAGQKIKEETVAPEAGIPAAEGTSPTAAGQTAGAADTVAAPQEAISALSDDELTFNTETRVIKFDQNKGAIASILLKDYDKDKDHREPVELLTGPLVVQGTTQILDRAGKFGFSAKREGDKIAFSRREGNWEITQSFTVPASGYGLDVSVTFLNTSDQAQELTAGTLLHENIHLPKNTSSFLVPASASDLSFVYGHSGKREHKLVRDFCEDDEKSAYNLTNEKVDYFGLDRHYFLSSLWAKGQNMNYVIEKAGTPTEDVCPTATMISQSFGLVQSGSSVEMRLIGYHGPKKSRDLIAVDPGLESAIDYGFFRFLAFPLLKALEFVHNFAHNWGIAIIVVTILLKILFYPLTRSAAVSMKRMQKLQPEMNALREKYKNDPAKQQRELMAFMSTNKANPFKGCLPILPQIPVFFCFYNVLSLSAELRLAPFFGWITDLSYRDPYYITPLLLGAGMFLQQKLTPNPSMDKNQEKIMLMMPLVFTLMMLSLPAGMVIYMLTNTAVSILQQQWLNRQLAKQNI